MYKDTYTWHGSFAAPLSPFPDATGRLRRLYLLLVLLQMRRVLFFVTCLVRCRQLNIGRLMCVVYQALLKIRNNTLKHIGSELFVCLFLFFEEF